MMDMKGWGNPVCERNQLDILKVPNERQVEFNKHHESYQVTSPRLEDYSFPNSADDNDKRSRVSLKFLLSFPEKNSKL